MWLLESSVKKQIEAAQSSGFVPSAEQLGSFNLSMSAAAGDSGSRVMSVAGNVAEIAVKGVITETPSFMAMLFGGGNTTYPEIVNALAAADSDPAITEIVLAVDSPGGSLDGLFDTLAAMETTATPIHAKVSNKAASAAFALVSKADKITANNHAAQFGSVGVVVTKAVETDTIDITSTNAPKKRPNVSTDEGVAMVREELDAVHDIFVESIAVGRGTTVEKVNAEFGQGGMFLANEAQKRGMIDAIAAPKLSSVPSTVITTTASGGKTLEAPKMDLNLLKTQHADVFAAAKNEGMTEERDRVGAHLKMGTESGDMKTAVSAINDGSAMTMTLQSTYMMAAVNKRDIDSRQEESTDASAGDTTPAVVDEQASADAQGFAILETAANIAGYDLEK